MIVTSASCPACGGPIEFKIGSSIVVVCEYCNSAIARTDRDLENLGKVADLLDTRSPLEVGMTGSLDGRPFVLTGRAQLRHQAGGVWDEWYASFGGDRWGWLAEAQGRFYLTFPQRVADGQLIAPFEVLRPGDAVVVPGSPNRYIVSETGHATTISAEGEIPYALTPGERYAYADLEGDQSAFATIDFSESPPVVFHGREVTLNEIGVRATEDTFGASQRRVRVERLTCPHCGGPMELKAPDRSLRVTCPSCNSLLDVDHGKLRYLQTLEQGPQPIIPLGSEGNLLEGRFVVAGFMIRSCFVEGVRYPWEEYLLYNPQHGFRWLVRGDDHWTYVRPLSAGAVFDGETVVTWRDRTYKRFQDVTARVEHVLGEFYWRVEVGETSRATDFIRPPEMISKECTPAEVLWSLGTHLEREAVQKAFRLERELPKPRTVGPAQPNPIQNPLPTWLALTAIAVAIFVALEIVGPNREVLAKTFSFEALESKDATQTVFSDPFELGAMGNIYVKVSAPVDNSWFYVEGDLVNEETGLVQAFSLPVEYYHGVDAGESWSEGSTEAETFLSSLPAGRYTLRLEAQWNDERSTRWQAPMRASVEVRQGVPRLIHFLVVLVLLGVPALVQGLRRRQFEVRRWSESMFNPYESSSDDD